ncbi:MAG: FkbM family methyltransferase [Candidatus Helarchaeota archaeon]
MRIKTIKMKMKKLKKQKGLKAKVGMILNSLAWRYLSFKKWVFFKIFFRKKGIYLTWANDYRMYVNTKDEGLAADILRYHVREPYSTKIFKKLIKKNDIIFDIGANIGYYVLLEGLQAKKGKIIAIEPVRENFNLLKKNVELNKLKNILLLRAAVGSKNTVEKLYVYSERNVSGLMQMQNKKLLKTEIVKSYTLKNLVEKYGVLPTILRMDVEGYEYDIFQGCTSILNEMKNGSLIYFEFHPPLMNYKKSIKILNLFKKTNFKLIDSSIEPPMGAYKDIFAKLLFSIVDLFGVQTAENHKYNSIDEILKDKDFLKGDKGCCQVFLIKKQR